MDVDIQPMERDLLPQYVAFANQAWGKDAYQSSNRYLKWLYESHPSGNGYRDLLVAVSKDRRIVGSLHSFPIEWSTDGERFQVDVLHNFFADPAHKGAGAVLMMESLQRSKHAFCPGAMADVCKMHQAIKSQRMHVFWYRKIINPVTAPFRYCATKLRLMPPTYPQHHVCKKIGGASVESHPSMELQRKLSQTLVDRMLADTQTPLWNLPLFHWRFFHEMGPRHYVIHKSFVRGETDFLIVSIGFRKGMVVARLMETSCTEQLHFADLLGIAEKFVRRSGAHIMLINSADPWVNSALIFGGWKPLSKTPHSYIKHKKRKQRFNAPVFGPSAGDYGFEALV